MNRLLISTRTLLISGIAFLGFAAIAAVTVWAHFDQLANARQQQQAAERLALAKSLSEEFLQARRREKDFLLRLDEKYVSRHNAVSEAIAADLEALGALTTGEAEIQSLGEIADTYAEYAAQFGRVAGAWSEMGLDEKAGLRGTLRGAVHEAEELIKQHATDDLMVKLLMMRRHEKDFIIRKDPKYIGRLAERIAEFDVLMAEKDLDDAVKQEIAAALGAYRQNFQAFADMMLKIEEQAGTLSDLYAESEPRLAALRQEIETEYETATLDMATTSEQVFLLTIVLIAIIAAVCIAAAIIVGRSISSPIQLLTDRMTQLAEGDKSVEITVSGRDEVAQMAGAVQVFKENMIRNDQLQAESQAKQQEELERARALADLTQGFDGDAKALIDDLIAASKQLQTTADEMNGVAEDTGQRASAVATATEHTSSNVQTVATATNELSTSIAEIASQVASASTVAGEAAAQANTTSTVIDELSETVDKIGDVVTLIQAIAEQTNLLALNATIESARAGEAGKGFAVVASEVKNLAGQTSKATEEIAEQISTIQSRTSGAVSAIKGIVGKVGEMEEITGTVAAAIEQQNAATLEISQNIETVANAANDVNQNVTHVSAAAKQTGQMASDVNQASQQVNRHSASLSDRVNAFLADVRAA